MFLSREARDRAHRRHSSLTTNLGHSLVYASAFSVLTSNDLLRSLRFALIFPVTFTR